MTRTICIANTKCIYCPADLFLCYRICKKQVFSSRGTNEVIASIQSYLDVKTVGNVFICPDILFYNTKILFYLYI